MHKQENEGQTAGQRDDHFTPADLRLREAIMQALPGAVIGELGLVEYAPGDGRAILIHSQACAGPTWGPIREQIDWFIGAGIRVITCRSVAAASTAAAALSKPVHRSRREGCRK